MRFRNQGFGIYLCLLAVLAAAIVSPMAGADQVFQTIQTNQDSWVRAGNPIENNGINNQLLVRSGGKTDRTLVQFDVSSVPAGSTIESAYLELNVSNGPAAPRNYSVNRITNSWREGTGNSQNNNAALNGVTWYERQFGDNLWTGAGVWDWAAPGVDFLAAGDSTLTPSVNNVWMRWWNLVPDVTAWYNSPATNFGWVVKDTVEAGAVRTTRFSSRENGNPNLSPRLIISYVNATAAVDPPSVNAGENTTMSVSIDNSGGLFGDHIKQVTFTVPAGYSHIPTTAAGYEIIPPVGKNWSVTGLPTGTVGPQTVILTANNPAIDELIDGEAVLIRFSAMSPWAAGVSSWVTSATGIGNGVNLPAAQSMNVTGTTLDMTGGGDETLTSITLSGTDQTATGVLGSIMVRDARGDGTGWNVVVSATDFETTDTPMRTIGASGFTVTAPPPVTVIDGNTPPVSFSGNFSGVGFKLLSAAAGTGMGHYRIIPDIGLLVPAETYTGVYMSTVTETIFSGP